jgi:predicted dehydrogenase
MIATPDLSAENLDSESLASAPSSEKQSSENSASRKIRYAIVGLGWFAQSAALPAFAQAENSEVVALVSDDPFKLEEVGKQYNIDLTYTYDEFEDCLNSGEIDAVYIALPNHLHAEYTVRAADAGIHILCEKPMAVTAEDCRLMMDAASENNVKLMIAYRLHLEEANLEAIKIVQSGRIGEPRIFSSAFTQQTGEGNIRLDNAKGGGTLDDIGIYCINAARYLFQDQPIAVFATAANNGEERFKNVDEMTTAILRFPGDRLATFVVSFGASKVSTYQVIGTDGDLRVDSAYNTSGDIKHTLTIKDEKEERAFSSNDQLAAEFVYFSNCILNNQEPEPSGEEGLVDVQIIQALYRSIATKSFVEIDVPDRQQKPTPDQVVQRPAASKPADVVRATDPSGRKS